MSMGDISNTPYMKVVTQSYFFGWHTYVIYIPVMMTVVEDKSKLLVTSSAVVLDPKPLAPIDPNKYHNESFRYSYVNTPCGAIMCSTNFFPSINFLAPPSNTTPFFLLGRSNQHFLQSAHHDELRQSICQSKQNFVSRPKKRKKKTLMRSGDLIDQWQFSSKNWLVCWCQDDRQDIYLSIKTSRSSAAWFPARFWPSRHNPELRSRVGTKMCE